MQWLTDLIMAVMPLGHTILQSCWRFRTMDDIKLTL
jgi:hypothetical protein